MYQKNLGLKHFIVFLLLFAGVTFSSTDSTFWKKMDVGEGEFIFITGDDLDNIYAVRSGIDEDGIPKEFVLYNNYPNPFNPETNIRYYLPEETDVKIELFNTLGEKVSTLIESPKISGEHSVAIWSTALKLSSGTYFCRLTANGKVKTIKMVLLK